MKLTTSMPRDPERAASRWHVEWLIARRPYAPWHGIAITRYAPHVVVRGCLFSQIAWDVAFTQVGLAREPAVSAYEMTLEGTVSERVA